MPFDVQVEPDVDRFENAKLNGKANGTATASALPPLISATDLYNAQITRLRPVFDGLLYDGLTLLVARPKAGKSWLTLQAGVHVAGGRAIQGISSRETGRVLYGAFEEPASRTMARLRRISEPGAWTANLHFVYELLPLMGGGAEQLGACMEQLRPRLLVLDTLTATVKAAGKRESDVFRSQYAEVSLIRKLAEAFRCAVLLVHHTRKGLSDSAIEAVAGTGGIAAAVDSVWQLKRKPEGEATLEVIGREVEETTFAMRFEQEPFGWRVLGDDAAYLLNGERRQILDLLKDEGGMTPAQIAAAVGKSQPATRMLLKRMRDDAQVQKQGLKYLPSHSMSYAVTERERD